MSNPALCNVRSFAFFYSENSTIVKRFFSSSMICETRFVHIHAMQCRNSIFDSNASSTSRLGLSFSMHHQRCSLQRWSFFFFFRYYIPNLLCMYLKLVRSAYFTAIFKMRGNSFGSSILSQSKDGNKNLLFVDHMV